MDVRACSPKSSPQPNQPLWVREQWMLRSLDSAAATRTFIQSCLCLRPSRIVGISAYSHTGTHPTNTRPITTQLTHTDTHTQNRKPCDNHHNNKKSNQNAGSWVIHQQLFWPHFFLIGIPKRFRDWRYIRSVCAKLVGCLVVSAVDWTLFARGARPIDQKNI